MRCWKCGTQNSEDQERCRRCGAELIGRDFNDNELAQSDDVEDEEEFDEDESEDDEY